MLSLSKILFIVVILLVGVFIAYGINFYGNVRIAKGLVAKSLPFNFPNSTASKRILVVGDSTAVGTGAETPLVSVAGRFHQEFPDMEIVNLAENGAKVMDVLVQIRKATGKFDLVLIHAGANDILKLTPVRKATKTLAELLKEAKSKADTVVFLTGGNLGLAPVFVEPLDTFYTYRTNKMLEQFIRIAKEEGALFVDLYVTKEHPVVSQGLEQFYAPDQIHLNGKGYGEWYKKIRETMIEAGVQSI